MEQPNMPPNVMNGMHSMQRPQQGNEQQQMYAKIMTELRNNMGQVGNGWQATFDVGQRAGRVMQLYTQLRILNNEPQTCMRTAMSFELRTIQQSPDRETYEAIVRNKLSEIHAKRKEQMASAGMLGENMGMNANMPQNMNSNMQAMNANMQNGDMGMMSAQMNRTSGPPNPGFPTHLQHQMQPSPLPQQPGTIDPSFMQNTSMQQQMPTMMPAQPMNQGTGGQSNTGQQALQQEIANLSQMMFSQMPEDQKRNLRARWLSGNANEQQRAQFNLGQIDPVRHMLNARAREMILRQRGLNPNPSGMLNGNLSQPQVTQPGQPSIDLSSILGQQANALKLQESGEQVVPASNNANLAQMNLPQGINPQMLANQGNQQGNNAQMSNHLQQLMMEQQKQQAVQRQNLMAQQRAMAQQQQAQQLRGQQGGLTGQPGGLNAPNALNGGPAAQVNSPAMSMLNRPLVPPGQGTPGTPQPNKPQGMSQTPVNAANQLLQHHQQMMQQNNQPMNPGVQGEPQPQPHPDTIAMLKNVPPQYREKLSTMPPAQVKQVLQRMAQQRNAAHLAQQNMPTQMNGRNPQLANQQNMMNGMPQGMGSTMPGFNLQPSVNQQILGQGQMDPHFQQRLQQQQQNQFRQKAYDLRPFPRPLLQQLGIVVPDQVRSWGNLKQHVASTQSVLPPQMLEKIHAAQMQWFQQRPEEADLAFQSLRQLQVQNRANQQPQPPSTGPPNMQMLNGQAPPAQMVPPTAPMQAPQQNAGLNAGQGPMPKASQPPMPTLQETQIMKQRYAQLQNLSDEAARDLIWRRKKETFMQQQQAQQQEALRNAQTQRPAQPQSTSNVPQQPPQRPGQQPPRGAQPNQQANGANTTQKRQPPLQTDTDEVMEIPNPNVPQAVAPQPPPMQTNPSQPQQTPQGLPRALLSTLPKEQIDQINKVPQDQRGKLLQMFLHKQKEQNEALRRAQMGVLKNQQTPQPAAASAPIQQQGQDGNAAQRERQQRALQRAAALYQMIQKDLQKGPPVHVDAEGKQQAQIILKRLWPMLGQMNAAFVRGLMMDNFEDKVKLAMKATIVLLQNVADENGTIRDFLSLQPGKLKELENLVLSFLSASRPRTQQPQPQPQLQQMPPGTNAQAPPMQQQFQRTPAGKPPQQAQAMDRKPSQQQPHARKPSSSSKAPPAPTENKTFDWGAPSPHGIPKYDPGRNDLTPDKLKFPPNKKRRTGQTDSAASTPAAQAGTPGAAASPMGTTKMPSPEQTKKAPQQQQQLKQESIEREEQQRKWRCEDRMCDANIMGFPSEEQLRKHIESEHKLIDDPLAFLLENAPIDLSTASDNGKATKTQPKATPAPMARGGLKKEGQTPGVKQEVATPHSVATIGNTIATAAQPAPITQAPAKEKTLREALEETMGFEPFGSKPTVDAEAAVRGDVEDMQFDDIFQSTLSGMEGVDEDWNEFTNVTDWGLRPELESSPDLTPSDRASQSSRESDISQSERLKINFEWDPFGNGDTIVPETLRMQTLGLGSGSSPSGKNAGEDAEMADAGEKNQDDDMWKWTADTQAADWDTLFGPNCGLDGLE